MQAGRDNHFQDKSFGGSDSGNYTLEADDKFRSAQTVGPAVSSRCCSIEKSRDTGQ